MPYVVTFNDYQPSSRTDAVWIGARVLESASPTIAGTEIDDFPFVNDARVVPVGLDVNPLNPASRTFSTNVATLATGWYTVVFYDAAGLEEPTEPLFKGGPVVPSVQQVAQFLRARTMGAGGQLNTFTTTTDPNIDQVESYVQSATADVVSHVGRSIPAQASDLARKVIEVGTAMLIELGSEDVNETRYDRLKTLYDERFQRLFEAVVEYGGDVIDPIPEPGQPGSQVLGTPLPLGLKPAQGWTDDLVWD
jgi:hypothetical protein